MHRLLLSIVFAALAATCLATATTTTTQLQAASVGNSITVTSAQEMLFQALQYLQPLPSSWSATAPLSQWGHGVQVGGCPNPTNEPGDFYSIVLDPNVFTINKTVRLDLLNPAVPLCNITALPPTASSNDQAMILVINFSQLPDALQVLDAPQSRIETLSTLGPTFINITGAPNSLAYVDLTSSGIAGNLDFSHITYAGFRKYFNMSGNPDLIGSVDFTRQGVCNANFFLIDLRNTGITLVVTGLDGQGASCIGTSPGSGPDGFQIAVIVDPNTEVKDFDISKTFILDYYSYCMPVGSFDSDPTALPVISVTSINGADVIRMINPPYLCEMVLTNRIVAFDSGYLFDSTAFGAQLYPCLNISVAYAYKMFAPGPQIGVVDAITNETTVFGFCPDEPGDGEEQYFSVSLNDNAFMDFYNSGYNVTVRGWHTNGIYTTCFFPWHYFVEVGVTPPLYEHTIYNDEPLIAAIVSCMPAAAADNTTFGNWASVTLSQTATQVVFRDDLGNQLALSRFSFAPIQANTTYCLATQTLIYTWNVSMFSSTVQVSSLEGVVLQSCTYRGILQYLTLENPGINTFYHFDRVMAALADCLPRNSVSGQPGNWSSTLSRLALAPGSTTFGDLILIDQASGAEFVFGSTSCVINPSNASLHMCSSVNLFTGSLILDIYANRSTRLTYYQQAADHSLQNVTTCFVPDFPLLFDANGNNSFFRKNITDGWAPCFPASSDTTTFTSNISDLTYNAATGVISLQSTLVRNGTFVANVQFQTSSCDAIPIRPDQVTLCPGIPMRFSNDTVSEYCIGSMCRPMQSLEWSPAAGTSWASGTISVDDQISITSLTKMIAGGGSSTTGGGGGGTITACYPQCFVDLAQCDQLAYVVSQAMMCYVERGQLSGVMVPKIPDHCRSSPSIISVMSMVDAFNIGFPPLVATQCLNGGAAITTIATASSNVGTSYVLATSSGAAGYSTTTFDASGNIISGTSNAAVGLVAECTTCISLWLQQLYPTPLVFIGLNAAFNVFLVIVANYIIEPLVGPRIVKLKVKLLAALGALSRREVHAYEKWLLRCLSPYIASQYEIDYHIDMVCKIVNIERKKILSLQKQYEHSDFGDDDDFSDEQNNNNSINGPGPYDMSPSGRLAPPPGAEASTMMLRPNNGSMLTPRGSTSSRRHSSYLSSHITEETPEQKIESDDKFRSIYATQLMAGTRMLMSVGEISLRKLVELRDSCANRPTPVVRTNYIRFPTKKAKETSQLMTEITAENLLLSANDHDEELGGDDNISLGGESNSSMFTADLQLEDAIAAMDSDTTAEWVPFVLAQEWMDRQFLSPKDWLLFLQLLMVLVVVGRTFDLALVSSGANGSWEVFSAFYFLFLNGSAPVSLVVNAVFRVLYSKQFFGSATSHSRFAKLFAAIRHLTRDPFFMIPALLMLPALVSHVVTGLIIFPFLIGVSLLLVFITMKIRIKLPEVDEMQGKLRTCSLRTIGCIITRVLFRQTVMFVCVASIQLAFSYAMMFYAKREGTLLVSQGSWWDIVSVDFNARSIVCALAQVQSSAVSSWNLFYSQFV